MDWWRALILGLVEGLTEYLPVSSTGHLLVTQRLLGIPETEASNAYAVAIQGGAILAVLGLYRTRIQGVAAGVLGKNPQGRKLAESLLIAFLPAAVMGLLFDDPIEQLLFGPWPVIFAWAVGGGLLLAFGQKLRGTQGRGLEDIDRKTALIIGVAQCAALWPGTSRSLATIVGGLLAGLGMGAAVEFSFLLGLLTLGAATAYKTLKVGPLMWEAYGPMPLLIGSLSAAVSAWVSVRWMVGYLQSRSLAVFGWWRIIAATLVGISLWTGILEG